MPTESEVRATQANLPNWNQDYQEALDSLQPDNPLRQALDDTFRTINDLRERLVAVTQELPFVNVSDFGAALDGETLDSAALQAAMDALDGNGTVYIPNGTMLLDASVEIGQNITLRFGPGAKLKCVSVSFRSADWEWRQSSADKTKWYLTHVAGGYPYGKPTAMYATAQRYNDHLMVEYPLTTVPMVTGLVGDFFNDPVHGLQPNSSSNSRWFWGDIDGLGFDTIYVQLNTAVSPNSRPIDTIGAYFAPSFLGDVEARWNQHIFDFFPVRGKCRIAEFYAEWWGAKGDAEEIDIYTATGTNDKIPIEFAIHASAMCQNTVQLVAKYLVDPQIHAVSGAHVRGHGRDRTRIIGHKEYSYWTVFHEYVTNFSVDGVGIVGHPRNGHITLEHRESKNIRYTNCEIQSGGQYNVGHTRGRVDDCVYDNCLISLIATVGIEIGPGRNFELFDPHNIISRNLSIVNCQFTFNPAFASSNQGGLRVTYAIKLSYINGVRIVGCHFGPAHTYGHIFVSHRTRNITIDGCNFLGAVQDYVWSPSIHSVVGDCVKSPVTGYLYYCLADFGEQIEPSADNLQTHWRPIEGNFGICWHTGQYFFGVWNDSVTVSNCTFDGLYYALYLKQCGGAVISNCTFRNIRSRFVYTDGLGFTNPDGSPKKERIWNETDTYADGEMVRGPGGVYYQAIQAVPAGINPFEDTRYPNDPINTPQGTLTTGLGIFVGTYWEFFSDAFFVRNVKFDNCEFVNEPGQTASVAFVYIADDVEFDNCLFVRAPFGLYDTECRRFTLQNSRFVEVWGTPVYLTGSGHDVVNNRFIDCGETRGPSDAAHVEINATATHCYVGRNRFQQAKLTRNQLPYGVRNYGSNCEMEGNRSFGAATLYGDLSFDATQTSGIFGTGWGKDNASDQPILMWNRGRGAGFPRKLLEGQAHPTAGIYSAGDVILNSNPLQYQYAGWGLGNNAGAYKEIWDAGGDYKAGEWVKAANFRVYRAVKDGGQALDPLLDGASEYWELMDPTPYMDPPLFFPWGEFSELPGNTYFRKNLSYRMQWYTPLQNTEAELLVDNIDCGFMLLRGNTSAGQNVCLVVFDKETTQCSIVFQTSNHWEESATPGSGKFGLYKNAGESVVRLVNNVGTERYGTFVVMGFNMW